MTDHNWSEYQLDIFAAIADDSAGNLEIDAVAGSGKSTTCEEAIRQHTGDKHQRYLAFNKAIVESFLPRVNSTCEVKTFNAFGHGALMRSLSGKIRVDARKSYEFMRESNVIQGPDNRILRNMVSRLVSLCKNSLVYGSELDQVAQLAQGYNFAFGDDEELAIALAGNILDWSLDTADRGIIDFDDQLYVTLLKGLSLPRTERLFVDEAQDLNYARMVMCERMLTTHGRIFIIGDPHQAIYGFQGSRKTAMSEMAAKFNASMLPLSVCYRCPTSVLDIARQYVPQIQAADGAPVGIVKYHNEDFNVSIFKPSDLVLCRTNAPLIQLAWKLFYEHMPFQIAGREFGETLIRHIDLVLKKHKQKVMLSSQASHALADYGKEQAAKNHEKGAHGAAHAIEDQVAACIAICEQTSDTDEAKDVLGRMFDGRSGLTLSTVHKAKGVQAPRVFILEPQLMPFPKAEEGWELAQEYNLIYVAVTRAMQELHYIQLENIA